MILEDSTDFSLSLTCRGVVLDILSQVVDIGKAIDVKVLDIDWDRERISLGLKQLLPYPGRTLERNTPLVPCTW
ncbi:MAG: hypothetical protein Ct9H300mP15_19460 [Gemmatimonadota bacterium]|nr:MAG: hypothetical protein Ct9H300mP15_19460 [Gemmatimonadota bacterium]